MKVILLLCGLVVTLLSFATARTNNDAKNIVCYFNSKGLHRFGQARYSLADLEAALPYCTHLIYGYAGIEEDTNKIAYLDSANDKDTVEQNYKKIIRIKRKFPGLKILLSVGGGADADRTKYLNVLETGTTRSTFVNSAHSYIREHGFDGLDLAWEFPETKPKKVRSVVKKAWNSLKSIFKPSLDDKKAFQHREQFAMMVKQLRTAFNPENLLLTLSVIPNVNASVYYDVRKIIPDIDQVHILSFDYSTPQRNPDEADYTAPLNGLIDRNPDNNGNAAIRFWLDNGAAPTQLIYGIPTFARTFKMTDDSGKTGVPPLEIEGPGEEGAYTKEPGLLSYAEVCATEQPNGLVKVSDPTNRYGAYSYRLASYNQPGLWASYDDVPIVAEKTSFAKFKGLGGIAVCDLTLDDFKGYCTGTKYPLLRAVQSAL